MNSDLALLHRYRQQGDATAFAELVRTHAALVFSTARRVTRDAALAEDVAQEVFLTLARNSHRAIDSVAAWLHHVTRQRACDAIRSKTIRKRYEPAAELWYEATHEARWKDIEPFVDEALDELPENFRILLIEHFLEQRTQQELAQRLGMSQSTVSRQIEAALQGLRDALKRKGILCGVGLAGLLSANATHAAPAALATSAGKIAMSGIGAGGAATASTLTALLLAMNAPAKALLATAILAALSLPFLLSPKAAPSSPKPASAVASRSAVTLAPTVSPRPRTEHAPTVRNDSDLAQLAEEEQAPKDDRQLILEEFKRLGGLIKEEYVDQDIANIIQQQHGNDQAAFELDLLQQGQSLESFKTTRREMLIVSVMRARAVKGITDPDEKERALAAWLSDLRQKSVATSDR